jgi:dCMP deaminase
MKIDWDEYAISLAVVASLRSEDPYRKVGACALSHDNRVLGMAYNGLAQGFNVSPEFWKCRDGRRKYMIHAESNLLSLIKKGECKTIALTCSPCSACASLIVAHNVKNVIYKDIYEKDTNGLEILSFYKINHYQIDNVKIKNIIKQIYE